MARQPFLRALALLGGTLAWLFLLAATASADTCSTKERDPGHCQNTAWVPGVFIAGGGTATAVTIVRKLPPKRGGQDTPVDPDDCAGLAARYTAALRAYRDKIATSGVALDATLSQLKTLDQERQRTVDEWMGIKDKAYELTDSMMVIAGELFALEAAGAAVVRGSEVAALWGLNTARGKAALDAVRTAVGLAKAAGTAEAAGAGAAGGSTLGPLGALGGAIASVLALIVIENVEKRIGDYMTADTVKRLNERHAALDASVKELQRKEEHVKTQVRDQFQKRHELKTEYENAFDATEKELDALHQQAAQALAAYYDARCGSRYPLSDLPERTPRQKADLSDPVSATKLGAFLKWLGAI